MQPNSRREVRGSKNSGAADHGFRNQSWLKPGEAMMHRGRSHPLGMTPRWLVRLGELDQLRRSDCPRTGSRLFDARYPGFVFPKSWLVIMARVFPIPWSRAP